MTNLKLSNRGPVGHIQRNEAGGESDVRSLNRSGGVDAGMTHLGMPERTLFGTATRRMRCADSTEGPWQNWARELVIDAGDGRPADEEDAATTYGSPLPQVILAAFFTLSVLGAALSASAVMFQRMIDEIQRVAPSELLRAFSGV